MKTMKAVVIHSFGDRSELVVESIPVPEIARDEVLIRLAYAGIGSWDVFERAGGYAQMLGMSPDFPYVLGSEGAGTVVETGADVTQFQEGDRVMASGFLNAKGGFYAEYAAVNQDTVARVPSSYSTVEASIVLGVGITALRGIVDTLNVSRGETVCVFGASGGIGHLAVQIARAIGARVVAVGSGPDGVNLLRKLGAAFVFDGRVDAELRSMRVAIGEGFDKVLLTAGGPAAEELCRLTRPGGAIAFPAGIYPEPEVKEGIARRSYHGEPNGDITSRLLDMIENHDIKPHIDSVFSAFEAAAAHERLVDHHLGKIALDIRSLV